MSIDATVVIKGRNELGLAVSQAERQLRGLLKQGELIGKVFRGGAVAAAVFAFERLAESAEEAAEKSGDKGTARSLRQLNREIDNLKAKGQNLIGKVLGSIGAALQTYHGTDLDKVTLQVQHLREELDRLRQSNGGTLEGLNVSDRIAQLQALTAKQDLYSKNLPANERERAPGSHGGGSMLSERPDLVIAEEQRIKALKDRLDALFPEIQLSAAKIGGGIYDDIQDRTKTAIDAAIQQWMTAQSEIADAAAAGVLSPTQVADRIAYAKEQYMRTLDSELPEAVVTAEQIIPPREIQKVNAFAEEMARNLQDSFAAYLFNPFDKGLKGMLGGFIDMLRQMVAQIAAQQILTAFFSWGKSLGGGLGSLFGSALTGISGTRAGGGPVLAGHAYTVGERGSERFVPHANGMIVPNGGGEVVVNNYITINDETDLKRNMPAIAAAITQQSVAQARAQMVRSLERRGHI